MSDTMTPEQLAEAILSAAGSGLRHYTVTSRQRIIDAAEAQIATLQGIPVGLGVLELPAAPLEAAPQPRNDPSGYAEPSDTINAPHGAENGADNG
ncbi:hypothetical protein PARHAE_00743 [Paracoccus haematequi]|uniref:Uncharacterized protein n=1 Tax=Paracoccus haematequi TaxID=2491866 RepID=A0A447IJ96_9RHOB|nr:hypothetical protein [Paracoccus haematequi]VDS07566.1 hypothetical protein PARHAE_00743 [Paracoccus haematequi]